MIVVHYNPPALENSIVPVTIEPDPELAPLSPPSVDGVGQAGLIFGDTANLSPDALMAYCQARLDSIDGQIRGVFNQQSARNGEAAGLQQVIATFQHFAGGVNKGDKEGHAQCLEMETALNNYILQIQATDPSFPGLDKLKQTFNELLYTGTGPQPDAKPPLVYIDEITHPYDSSLPGPDNVIGSDEAQGFLQSLQGIGSELSSGAEMQMIQIQSLMSQRQTAVQLTTNLVQSLGSQTQKIAENIGH